MGGRLARVEELLNVRATSSVAIPRDIHREQLLPRERTLEVSDKAPESPRRQYDVNYLKQGEGPSRFEDRPLNDIEGTASKKEGTASPQERPHLDRKEHGSLVVNDQGDLQYLGKIKRFSTSYCTY